MKWRVYAVKYPMNMDGTAYGGKRPKDGWFWIRNGVVLWIKVHGLRNARWLCGILNRHNNTMEARRILVSADEKLPSDVSSCDNCGGAMPVVYEANGHHYCSKCAGPDALIEGNPSVN